MVQLSNLYLSRRSENEGQIGSREGQTCNVCDAAYNAMYCNVTQHVFMYVRVYIDG